MTEESPRTPKSSYGSILKSSAVIGASQGLVILIGVARAKVVAVLLGPAGFGLMSLYWAVADMAVTTAGLGVGNSGIRQVAEAVGTNDEARIWRTVAALRRLSAVLGVLGAVILLAVAVPVSSFTFGDTAHAGGVALISIAVLLRIVSAGQSALIQGMRRISDLATINLLTALGGAIATGALVYVYGEGGIPASIVATALMGLALSTAYSAKATRGAPKVSWLQTGGEIRRLLPLGIAFLISGVIMMGTMYMVRVVVTRQLGLDAAGLYSAAWAIGGVYVNVLLQSMGADFYPRLAGAISHNRTANRLVNEQARVSLLLAGPGVVFTLAFAPLLMVLLYSEGFEPAGRLLQWLCLGMMLRVVTWPMGVIVVAKGATVLVVVTELAWAVANVTLTLVLMRFIGLDGVGLAFLGANLFHGLLMYHVVNRISGFRLSSQNFWLATALMIVVAAMLAISFLTPKLVGFTLGFVCTVATGLYALRSIAELAPVEKIPPPLRRVFGFLRIGFRGPHA